MKSAESPSSLMTPSLIEAALKKTELLAKVYEHARHRFTHGLRMLTLDRSDGEIATFLALPALKGISALLKS